LLDVPGWTSREAPANGNVLEAVDDPAFRRLRPLACTLAVVELFDKNATVAAFATPQSEAKTPTCAWWSCTAGAATPRHAARTAGRLPSGAGLRMPPFADLSTAKVP